MVWEGGGREAPPYPDVYVESEEPIFCSFSANFSIVPMSNPAKKPADKSSAIAPRSHRTRGPRLLLTTSEHARLSKMAKQRGRPMARYARERALAHVAGPPTTYGTDDVQSIRNAGSRLNQFMHRINYTDGMLYSGQRKDYGQKWIHTSEVQAEIRHLEAFLQKLPHHVGRSYWRTD